MARKSAMECRKTNFRESFGRQRGSGEKRRQKDDWGTGLSVCGRESPGTRCRAYPRYGELFLLWMVLIVDYHRGLCRLYGPQRPVFSEEDLHSEVPAARPPAKQMIAEESAGGVL